MEVKEFVDLNLGQAAKVVQESGFIPLPEEIYTRCFDRLDAGAKGMGTHFLEASGEMRRGSLTNIYQAENLVQELLDNDGGK